MSTKLPRRRMIAFIPATHLLLATAALAAMPAQQHETATTHVKDGLALPRRGAPAEAGLLRYVPGKMIVKLKEGMTPERIGPAKEKHALKISQKRLANDSHPRFRNLYEVRTSDGEDLPALAAELMADPAVEYAEPVGISYTRLVPNDSYYQQQWSHKKTQAEAGWDITTGSPSVVIAVVDTGVAYTHPDLAANIWHDGLGNPGKDFVDVVTSSYTGSGYQLVTGEDYTTVDGSPADYNGHGTHVAGIVAAAGNNNVGVSGVCPSCRIMPVRAGFTMRYNGADYGMFEHDDIANAIIYAADNGARVINMSFGGSGSQVLQDAISYADGKGVLLVAAAGNSNSSDPSNAYPAVYANVLPVGATDQNDVRASYSNYGSWIGVAAPGGDAGANAILSTVPTTGSLSDPSGYRGLSGTSMASPYVAGLAGLVLSKNPSLSNRQVAQIIREGVDVYHVDIPDSPVYLGTGRVNVLKALQIDSVSSATASIASPAADFLAGAATLEISGSASAPYQVSYGAGLYPSSWTLLASGPAASGVLATLDPALLPAPFGDYSLKLSAQDQNGKVETTVHGRIGKQFLPGWPQKYSQGGSGYLWNAPALADIDNDGFAELLVTGQDGSTQPVVSVFKQDGTLLPGWPQTVLASGATMNYGVAAGDLDQDGNQEVVGTWSNPAATNHGLRVWDRYGNVRWTKMLEWGKQALNVTLADLNGDGNLEILTQTVNSRLWALDNTGKVLWSYDPGEYDSWYRDKSVAVADLDGDGKKEIVKNVIRSVRYLPSDLYRTVAGSVLVFNSDGTVRWRYDWPEAGEPLTDKYYQIFPAGSPVVGDIDSDGVPEVLVKCNVWKGNDSGPTEVTTRFYAFDASGSVLPGWPVSAAGFPHNSELALGDLKRDGYRELVGSTDNALLAIRHTGELLFPPAPVVPESNLSIADVTGDGSPDIVAFDGASFHAVEADGTLSSLPVKATNAGYNLHNSAVLTDLNKSGSEKLIFLDMDARSLWAWDLQAPHAPETEQWTQFGFDARHGGALGSPSLSPVAVSTAAFLPGAVVGAPYSQPLAAAGGSAPYAWSLAKGSLPGGVTLDSGGLLSGTPVSAGTSGFSLRAVDAQGRSALRSFVLSTAAQQGDLLPAKLFQATPLYFTLLQDAYSGAADGDTIGLQGVAFGESAYFSRDVRVTLQGGYDGSYAANNGRTVINGLLAVRNGTVKIDSLIFR